MKGAAHALPPGVQKMESASGAGRRKARRIFSSANSSKHLSVTHPWKRADAGYRGTFILDEDQLLGLGVDISKKIKLHGREKILGCRVFEPSLSE